MSYQKLIGDLKKKIYAPVYFLHGDESYFTDKVVEFIENHVLSESDKEFNQTILYGKDVDALSLISYAKRYPMMASHQVVIVKEAQDIRNLVQKDKDRDPFLEYLEHPTPTTLLVLAYKHKPVDKRTRLYKALTKKAVMLESKKLYDNEIPNWVTEYFLSKSGRIQKEAAIRMGQYLLISVPDGREVTVAMVQEKIGISKEFNIFELYTAFAKRDIYKANLIAKYMGSNTKNNPIQLTLPSIFSFYNKVLSLHAAGLRKDKSELAALVGTSPYFIGEYLQAAEMYPMNICMRNIGYIREYDLKSKGVNAEQMDTTSLLKELVYKLMH
jgi:DNA polymerase-3 subunit delta